MDGPFDAALIDTNFDNTGSCVSWPALNIAPCNVALGGRGPVTIATGSYRFDTDRGMLADSASTVTLPGALVPQSNGGPMVRVVNASRLTIDAGATVTVVGSHPVIFVVHGDAAINGIIDASAQVDGAGQRTAGPGGNDASQCMTAIGKDGIDALVTGGAGGAGGGGYGANGGNGGNGAGGAHGEHGRAVSDGMISPLRGGCHGGTGGKEFLGVGGHGGQPGDGGGAIEITALGQITINGTIRAGGSGGGVGGAGLALVSAGGGGGGSGGAIVLDGATSTVTAGGKLCANGGGGGEGGQTGMTSSPGLAATCTTTPAAGGATQADGGDGGAGGTSGDGANGKDGNNGAAGGGGGGSVGRIRVHGRSKAPMPGGLVSPPATP